MIRRGDEAPDFLARSIDNKGIWLRALRGRPVVLVFLPPLSTPGCALEIERYRDNYQEIQSLGAEVVGVLIDENDAPRRLSCELGVTFPVIADDAKLIARSYGLLSAALYVERRASILIDEQGIVEAVVTPEAPETPQTPQTRETLDAIETREARQARETLDAIETREARETPKCEDFSGSDDIIARLREHDPSRGSSPPTRRSRIPGAMVADRYRLKRKLAEGGIGEVWCAEHIQLKQDVALKLLKASQRSSPDQAVELLERFRMESQLAALLGRRTPHVISVHDAGFSEIGPFLAMELVDGKTLLDEIDQNGMIEPARILAVLEQVVDALETAHAAGIVHRDLKPGNIMIVDDPNGSVHVKVTDFGIAKTTDLALTLDRPQETIETVVMGTPEYMSPEQLRGGEKANPQMDIWSLGVVVYQALTGMLPFEAPTVQEVIAKVATADFVRATKRRSDLPKALDAWFEQALAREPFERFSSVRALLDAYRAAISLADSRRAYPGTPLGSGLTVIVPEKVRSAGPMAVIVGMLVAICVGGTWLSLRGSSSSNVRSSRSGAVSPPARVVSAAPPPASAAVPAPLPAANPSTTSSSSSSAVARAPTSAPPAAAKSSSTASAKPPPPRPSPTSSDPSTVF